MPDNVPVTPGSGANIATDNVGDVHYQIVKLNLGGDGLSVPVIDVLPVAIMTNPNNSLPLATNVSSTLTLTDADTAYQITEPTSAFLVTYCNNSDTDMYWGFATLTTGGILLAKSGGTVSMACAANNSPFFYCASAGKVLNYTTTVLN